VRSALTDGPVSVFVGPDVGLATLPCGSFRALPRFDLAIIRRWVTEEAASLAAASVQQEDRDKQDEERNNAEYKPNDESDRFIAMTRRV